MRSGDVWVLLCVGSFGRHACSERSMVRAPAPLSAGARGSSCAKKRHVSSPLATHLGHPLAARWY
eukprot:6863446-Heterocapsa_arctica.AAC.1